MQERAAERRKREGVAAALEYEIQPPNMQAPTPKTPHKEDLRSEYLISMQYGQRERLASATLPLGFRVRVRVSIGL